MAEDKKGAKNKEPEKNKNKGKQEESPKEPQEGEKEKDKPAAPEEDERQQKEKEERKGKGKDKDQTAGKKEENVEGEGEGEGDEVAGSTIDRLRAFYPEKIKDFRRTEFYPYDEAGDDASVGYGIDQKGRIPWVVFTAYFYPARGDSLDEDIKAAIRDVTSQHEEAEVGEPEVVEVTRHGKKREGRRVRFKFTHAFGGKEQPLASELYLFPGTPGRLVKYRISYPAADAEKLQKKVDKFAESFPWPPGM
ncbi:MAG: hypothetical protein AVDCRST_MAG64-975 [uncultured Phycisphaerae bacterium]|uniref:Uncharacterized protein n=1 Tax=uncultured Phycisphaerae bacterium TaxID=904963 RepID=A0A6J4NKM3_9BACT|nr:MAG: hypothetical protein AVDCRST_MAG64-975 [uncultured Phycisphaerae bacterium]